MKREERLKYNSKDFDNTLKPEHKEHIDKVKESLFDLIEKWLERIPFIKTKDFDFWEKYRSSAEEMLQHEEEIIKSNQTLTEEKRQTQLENFTKTREGFLSLFDENYHNELISKGEKRLSFKEQRKLETIEKEMPELEEQRTRIMESLNNETEYEKIAVLSKSLESTTEKLEEMEMRWLELQM